ncbi:hypothetical protein PS1_042960 [Malus domestica]
MPVTTIAKSVDANERGGRKRGNFCGRIYTSEIDGTIQLKMSIGRGGGSAYGNHSAVENAFRRTGVVILDDCNFHESVHLDSFNVDRTLTLIVGGSELTLQAKLTFSQESLGNITKEAGPLSMTFTIPIVNASRLLVKYLHITKKWKSYNPYRWVRYATHSNSYVAGL